MLKKLITFTNPFTDEEETEEHYFNISKADLVEMEMVDHNVKYTSKTGQELTGLQAKLQKIIDSEDGRALLTEMKDLVRRAYGKRDGNSFIKTPEVWQAFASSEAYNQLIWELCTDAKKSAEFMQGIIPNNLDQIAREIAQQAEAEEQKTPATVTDITAERESTVQSPAVGAVMDAEDESSARIGAIENATAESPVTLTQDEARAMPHEKLSSGLADGRYKLS